MPAKWKKVISRLQVIDLSVDERLFQRCNQQDRKVDLGEEF